MLYIKWNRKSDITRNTLPNKLEGGNDLHNWINWLKQIVELLNQSASYLDYWQVLPRIREEMQEEVPLLSASWKNIWQEIKKELKIKVSKTPKQAGEVKEIGRQTAVTGDKMQKWLGRIKQSWQAQNWEESLLALTELQAQSPKAEASSYTLFKQTKQDKHQEAKQQVLSSLLSFLVSDEKADKIVAQYSNFALQNQAESEKMQALVNFLRPTAENSELSAWNTAVKLLTDSGHNSSIVQNVQFSNVFNGEKAAQSRLAQAMREAAGLTAGELARALAYGR